MIASRVVLTGFALMTLAACAAPPAPIAQVDETRTQRQVRDAKTELEQGSRR